MKRDIIITIPASIDWSDYQRGIDNVTEGDQVLNFKVRAFTKDSEPGKKCYVSHKNVIKGWMLITGYSNQSFKCTTTGKVWEGKFIQRSGPFHKLDLPVPYIGFRGFRYIN